MLTASEPEQLLGALDALGRGEPGPATQTGKAAPGVKLAYLFTGQGSQRAGMGKQLYETYPAYREALDAVLAELDPHLERPLAEVLFAAPDSAEAELLDHTSYAQPALFATEVAIFRLLESFGMRPNLLAGHSIGEIAAAHLAGVFSLPDAAKLVSARGRLMGELPEGGAMLAVQATEQEIAASLAGKEAELSIAAINAPGSVVVSGAKEAIETVEADWQERGRKTKRLVVSHAFHSPLMEPMLEPFAEVAKSIAYQSPEIPIVSNASGELLGAEQAADPAYWVAQVRQPVRFADAVGTLAELGASAYLEIGPDAVLSAMASECLQAEEQEAQTIPTLREGRAEPEALIGALGEAHAVGAKVQWPAFFTGSGAKAVALPTYAFQRERYWLSASAGAGNVSAAGQTSVGHPLLGAAVELPVSEGLLLTGRVSLTSHAWLADREGTGTVLFPAFAFAELALAAGERLGTGVVEELVVQAPLVMPEQGAVQLQVAVEAADAQGRREVSIHSRPEADDGEEWTRHARGVLSAESAAAPQPIDLDAEQWPPAITLPSTTTKTPSASACTRRCSKPPWPPPPPRAIPTPCPTSGEECACTPREQPPCACVSALPRKATP